MNALHMETVGAMYRAMELHEAAICLMEGCAVADPDRRAYLARALEEQAYAIIEDAFDATPQAASRPAHCPPV